MAIFSKLFDHYYFFGYVESESDTIQEVLDWLNLHEIKYFMRDSDATGHKFKYTTVISPILNEITKTMFLMHWKIDEDNNESNYHSDFIKLFKYWRGEEHYYGSYKTKIWSSMSR